MTPVSRAEAVRHAVMLAVELYGWALVARAAWRHVARPLLERAGRRAAIGRACTRAPRVLP